MHISKAVVAVLLAVMNVAVAAPLSGEAKAIEERAFPPEPETRGGQVYSASKSIDSTAYSGSTCQSNAD